jgi:hypothetical protein
MPEGTTVLGADDEGGTDDGVASGPAQGSPSRSLQPVLQPVLQTSLRSRRPEGRLKVACWWHLKATLGLEPLEERSLQVWVDVVTSSL